MRVLCVCVCARVIFLTAPFCPRRPGRPPPNAAAEAEAGGVQRDVGADRPLQHGLHRQGGKVRTLVTVARRTFPPPPLLEGVA